MNVYKILYRYLRLKTLNRYVSYSSNYKKKKNATENVVYSPSLRRLSLYVLTIINYLFLIPNGMFIMMA